jgi:ribosomal-protein-alanine N-acetyltransferase
MRPVIETERLALGLPQPADAPAIAAYYAENQAHLAPWSPAWPEGFFSTEFWREQAKASQSDFHSQVAVRTFIRLRDDPGRVIGNLALTQIHRGSAHYCAMGYSLDRRAQGHGYMLEAVRAGVDYAFADLRLHRVMANYMPHNVRSAAVLRRAGFTVEGYARDYLLINGRWEDHILTSVVNPEWGS